MKTKKIVRYGLILFAALILFLIVGRSAGWIGSFEGHRVTTEKAEKRTIVETVTASGKVRPVTEVKISPDVSGEIIELNIEEGDFVERGQLLVRINPDLYESALDRVEASLNTSRANLANARARTSQAEAQFINAQASYNRNKRLYDENTISESEYDTARSNFLVAQAEVEAARQSVIGAEFQVKSAEASVKEARESLLKTNIFSPMNGTISRLDVEIGERVVGTSQFAGTEIMRIANFDRMEVLVDVNENDIVRVSQGDTAFIDLDAFFTETFTGVVTSIANSAKEEGLATDQVTNFEVRILILPDSYAHLVPGGQVATSPFRPGMSATVDIQTMRAEDVITVPIQAVTTREADGQRSRSDRGGSQEGSRRARPQEYVFLYKDGKAVQHPVSSGIQDTYHIQIVEGLEEGQEVISGPYRMVSRELKDGEEVVKSRREEVFQQD